MTESSQYGELVPVHDGIGPTGSSALSIFDRAVQRGEIPDTAAGALAYEALIGTMHFRILARRRPLDDDIAERLVGLVLEGVLP